MHATLLRIIYIAKETNNNKLLSSSIFLLDFVQICHIKSKYVEVSCCYVTDVGFV